MIGVILLILIGSVAAGVCMLIAITEWHKKNMFKAVLMSSAAFCIGIIVSHQSFLKILAIVTQEIKTIIE